MTEIRPEKITGTDKKAAAGKGIGDAFRRAQDHSRRVRLLKLALPVVSLLIIAAFFGYSWLMTPGSVSVDVTGTAYADGKLVMANPKLEGFTSDDRPYSMTAERAIQNLDSTGVIRLERIDAKLPIDGDNWAHVDAPSGIYDRDNNPLQFDSAVTVKTTDGREVKLKSAFFDIAKGDLKTTDPVDIVLNGAKVAADSMTVLENGKILIFENRVRMNITPDRLKTSAETTGGTNDG